ncbi:SAM-dependent methyltransferase [Salinisphaera aquimarina]|uniref:SAM-dependent methyltransferase n=1 Tax=Salinisphaera aquimarina TaxID=2094031 RepID=A0ABV7ES51_9GAMM
MRPIPDTSPAFFERLYRHNPDPWDFKRSPYETARYQRMLNALGGRHFERAYEPGCSIGAFTARLAPFCGELVACDASNCAVGRTRERMKRFPQVAVTHAVLPGDLSPGPFDLIVFAEIGYYFELPVLQQLVHNLASCLRPGGVMLGCHWLGDSADHVLHGAQVHALIEQNGFTPVRPRPVSDDGYRLDVWAAER